MDNAGEVERRDLDVLDIRVEELEKVVGRRRLLAVLHANAQLVGIARGEVERERVVIAHRLDELEEVDHVDTENVLGGAEIVLKAVAVESKID